MPSERVTGNGDDVQRLARMRTFSGRRLEATKQRQHEDSFAAWWARLHPTQPAPERELTFAKPRRFRFDFAWPEQRVAVEIDGGVWVGGRHSTGAGYEKDAEKMNLAAVHGWRVLHFTPGMLQRDPIACCGAVLLALKRGAA